MKERVFNFTTLRPPQENADKESIRYIEDPRTGDTASFLQSIEGFTEFQEKLTFALDYIEQTANVSATDLALVFYFRKKLYTDLKYEELVNYLRKNLRKGVPIKDLISDLAKINPVFRNLFDADGWDGAETAAFYIALTSIWNTLYINMIIGCTTPIDTSYVIDSIKAMYLLLLLKGIQVAARGRTPDQIAQIKWKLPYDFDDFQVLLPATFWIPIQGAYPIQDPRTVDPIGPEFPCVKATPMETSCLAPLYVGDLMVVENELCGYKQGEIAEIENILAKETRKVTVNNSTTITEETETVELLENESSTSTKLDERFQLNIQSQKAQQTNSTVSAGLSSNFNFPSGDISISANASYSNAKQSAYNVSKEHAKTITQEASETIKQSIKTTNKLTIVNSYSREEFHSFENTTSNHVVGIYRWVDKVYRATLNDYGKRLFMEIWVPEPAHYLKGLTEREENRVVIEPPVHPKDTNDKLTDHHKINRNNYAKLCATYGVTDYVVPPQELIVMGKSVTLPEEVLEAGSLEDHHNRSNEGNYTNEVSYVNKVTDLKITEGYTLDTAGVYMPLGELTKEALRLNKDHNNSILVVIGDKHITWDITFDIADDRKFNTMHPMGAMQGDTIPVVVITEFEGLAAFNIRYRLKVTDRHMEDWKKGIFNQIMQNYQDQYDAYLQAKRQAELIKEDGIEELTLQPREADYRAIESQELQKHCIDIFSNHTAYDWYNESTLGYNKSYSDIHIEPTNKRKHIVQFFEDCIEWEQLSYKFYPYFWTDSAHTNNRRDTLYKTRTTGDPIHDAFLKAGYAKVIVPIRPEREENILFFLETHHIWKGTKLPVINKPKYRAFLDELHESKQLKKGEGVQVGEPWEVVLPTNLVILQNKEDGTPDDQLPTHLCSKSVPEPEEEFPEISKPKIPQGVFTPGDYNEVTEGLDGAI